MLTSRTGSILWLAAAATALALAGALFWHFHGLPKWAPSAGAITTRSILAVEDVIRRQSGLGQVSPKLLILIADGLVCFALGRFLLRDGEGRHS